MSATWTEVMGLEPYDLQLSLPAGEAVARWLKHHHPMHTAKLVARDTGLDPRTVENILDGHISGATLTKLILAYRFAFGLTILEAVLGETYAESLEHELEDIAHERRELDTREEDLRGSWARLRARSAVDGLGLRLVPQEAFGRLEPLGRNGGGPDHSRASADLAQPRNFAPRKRR